MKRIDPELQAYRNTVKRLKKNAYTEETNQFQKDLAHVEAYLERMKQQAKKKN